MQISAHFSKVDVNRRYASSSSKPSSISSSSACFPAASWLAASNLSSIVFRFWTVASSVVDCSFGTAYWASFSIACTLSTGFNAAMSFMNCSDV
nr:MAG TPA: hypothetical protein [Caudoviricetes sp.]